MYVEHFFSLCLSQLFDWRFFFSCTILHLLHISFDSMHFSLQSLLSTVVIHIYPTTTATKISKKKHTHRRFFSNIQSNTIYESSSICVLVAMCTFSQQKHHFPNYCIHKLHVFDMPNEMAKKTTIASQCNAWICFFPSINILKFSANVFRLLYLPLYPVSYTHVWCLLFFFVSANGHHSFCCCYLFFYFVCAFAIPLIFHMNYYWRFFNVKNRNRCVQIPYP